MITFTKEESVFIYDALRFQNGRERQFTWLEEIEKHVWIFRKFKSEIIPLEGGNLTFKDTVKVDLTTEEKSALIEIIKSEPWTVGKWDIALTVKDKLK